MDDDEIIERLACLYLTEADRSPSRGEAEAFLAMYREMRDVDQEITERKRVEHASEMSRPRR